MKGSHVNKCENKIKRNYVPKNSGKYNMKVMKILLQLWWNLWWRFNFLWWVAKRTSGKNWMLKKVAKIVEMSATQSWICWRQKFTSWLAGATMQLPPLKPWSWALRLFTLFRAIFTRGQASLYVTITKGERLRECRLLFVPQGLRLQESGTFWRKKIPFMVNIVLPVFFCTVMLF